MQTNERWLLLVNEDQQRIVDGLVEALSKEVDSREPVTIVTARMTLRGLLQLLPAFRRLAQSGTELRVLLGVVQDESAAVTAPFDPTQTPNDVGPLLAAADRTIRAEINEMPLSKAVALAMIELLGFLDAGRVRCRREEHRVLDATGVVLPHQNTGMIGSARLTTAALTSNRGWLGALTSAAQPEMVHWADQWWTQAAEYALADQIRVKFLPHQPQLIYLRMLQLAFGDQVNAPSWSYLRDDQCDGVAKALSILARINGALLCDDVGLGKTDQALAIARHVTNTYPGRVLLVCPASLKRWWEEGGQRWMLPIDVISYESLTRIVEAEAGEFHHYALIICDEAHRLRNPKVKRIAAIRTVISAQPEPPRLLLLTATPVNNTGLDLFELLSLADQTLEPQWKPVKATAPQRAHARSSVARPLLNGCRDAHTWAPDSGKVRGFHDELDRRMVRRTRWLIQREYPGSAKSFPERQHLRVEYTLTPRLRSLTADVMDALGAATLLAPETARQLRELRGPKPQTRPLNLAAYLPQQYANEHMPAMPLGPMAALIKIMLLKRLESSPAALATTARRMAARVELALYDLDNGRVCLPHPSLARRLLAALGTGLPIDEDVEHSLPYAEDDDIDGLLLNNLVPPAAQHALPATDFDVVAFRAALTHDREILRRLSADASLAAREDPKFLAFANQLAQLSRDRPGEKILVLISSRHTAVDLYHRLQRVVAFDPRLRHLQDHIANAAPLPPLSTNELLDLVARFAPRTAARPRRSVRQHHSPNLYDMLIGTDVLSEGHNLQQASIVINYDLPWNPQALEQRIGRVDRHGAERPTVACVTLLPDAGLDILLNLLKTLHGKIAIAAALVGVPSAILPGTHATPLDFASALDRLDQPRPTTVTEREHQRAILGNALRLPGTIEALNALPLPAGAVHPGRHHQQGAIFCFRIHGDDDSSDIVYCHLEDRPDAQADFDQDRCLRRAHLDLSGWTPPTPQQLLQPVEDPLLFQQLLLRLTGRARRQTAARLNIPTDEAETRIQLLVWFAMLRQHADAV
ncbi:SNF2-related protein [Micromonospora vulcania]|uniref:SNF2-related protein n=1 Tax=Micromonospora vulcania TaxID=1441873 RepID=A0ABW1H4B0_9ACTN